MQGGTRRTGDAQGGHASVLADQSLQLGTHTAIHVAGGEVQDAQGCRVAQGLHDGACSLVDGVPWRLCEETSACTYAHTHTKKKRRREQEHNRTKKKENTLATEKVSREGHSRSPSASTWAPPTLMLLPGNAQTKKKKWGERRGGKKTRNKRAHHSSGGRAGNECS